MGILKNQLPNSTLGLKGSTPSTIAGSLSTSQTHYNTKLKAQKPDHSIHDYDGQRPDPAYLENLPE